MLEAVLSWALIISSPGSVKPNTIVYVESEAVCRKDSDYIANKMNNTIVMCIPVRADVPAVK